MPSSDGGRKINRYKQPAKAIFQVMTALKHSKNENGPTMRDIVKYISRGLFKPATKRQIMTALKRSVEFGIITMKRGRYQLSLSTDNKPPSQQAPASVPTNRESSDLLEKMPKSFMLIKPPRAKNKILRREFKNQKITCRNNRIYDNENDNENDNDDDDEDDDDIDIDN